MNALNKFRKPNQFFLDGSKGGSSGKGDAPVEMGHYVTKDQRQSMVQELKRAHFVLGSDRGTVNYMNDIF